MAMQIIPAETMARPARALPFWLSLSLVPVVIVAAVTGGWAIVAVPLASWGLFAVLDSVEGRDMTNADPATPVADLIWYRAITLIWFPVQVALLGWLLWYVPQAEHLGRVEAIGVFVGLGVIAGTIGINYAHELMHQTSRTERWLADLLLASVMYSHFRSEHLRVHHTHVGTPRDPVTARYNEGFHRFFLRVLHQSLRSSWRAEAAMMSRKGASKWHGSNPFWRYGALQGGFLALAFAIGGWTGVGLFLWQAFVAIWQLELVDYIEHYGLTRRHIGDGRYEHVLPHHSWNSDFRASNWLLINLQRHSDHHFKPDRRFPLLQTYDDRVAPQLPYGYPVMTTLAMVPPLWRRVMNPRVRAWRKLHYPDIADWTPYTKATNPVRE
jgi:alkane 1-monooxygenase